MTGSTDLIKLLIIITLVSPFNVHHLHPTSLASAERNLGLIYCIHYPQIECVMQLTDNELAACLRRRRRLWQSVDKLAVNLSRKKLQRMQANSVNCQNKSEKKRGNHVHIGYITEDTARPSVVNLLIDLFGTQIARIIKIAVLQPTA